MLISTLTISSARKVSFPSNGFNLIWILQDHTNLTITLVMIIIFFLITNIPESLASRTAAINLLFQGDHQRANTTTLEGFRQVCTILKAVDVNTNFVFYYTFCPAFCKTLRTVCRRVKKRPFSNLQVIVFVCWT